MTVAVPVSDALAPVRDALLTRARMEADALVAGAEAEAEAALGRARQEAEDLRALARAQGEADAEAVLVSARTRSRRRARARVLAAQRELYDELRRRVHRAAGDRASDPAGYDRLRRRLVERAHEALGPEAVVSEPPEGGVVARSGGRRFVCTLPDLADAALATVDVEGLWSP